MNDLQQRQALNTLTGLTIYDNFVGAQNLLVSGVWTSIYGLTLTSQHFIFTSYQISVGLAALNPVMRIISKLDALAGAISGADKIFPHFDDFAILDGVRQDFRFPLQVPKDYEFILQVKSDGIDGATHTATLDYLSVIKIDPYSAT